MLPHATRYKRRGPLYRPYPTRGVRPCSSISSRPPPATASASTAPYQAPARPSSAVVAGCVLVHGTGSNFYGSTLFDPLAERLLPLGVGVLRVNTRGHDLMSTAATARGGRRCGAAYEVVDDCRHDLAAWIGWLAERCGPRYRPDRPQPRRGQVPVRDGRRAGRAGEEDRGDLAAPVVARLVPGGRACDGLPRRLRPGQGRWSMRANRGRCWRCACPCPSS